MELIAEQYKQTDIGPIPSDWEVTSFGNLVNYIKGFPFKSRDYKTDGVRIIRVSDTTFDSIKKENAIYIAENRKYEFRLWKLDEYDLIFSTVGSKPPMYDSMVGKVILISKENTGCLLNQNAVLIRAKNKTKFVQSLLLNHFRTKRYLQHIEEIYRGNANQASITLEDLFKYQIPLPKEESEKIAIATALSDADNYVTHLEKLIDKKRLIKQGAMQQLLTIKNNWVLKKLSEVGNIVTGSTPPTGIDAYWNGSIPWITPTDISNFEKDICSSEREISKKGLQVIRKLPSNTLLVTCIASIGKNAILRKEGACNQQINAIIPNEYYDVDFLYYLIENNRQYILNKAGITATLIISKKDFSEIEFTVPNNKAEQVRIAVILNDMDTEIMSLEKQLTKAQNIKQGMMQELLTGKIRLV